MVLILAMDQRAAKDIFLDEGKLVLQTWGNHQATLLHSRSRVQGYGYHMAICIYIYILYIYIYIHILIRYICIYCK